MKKEKCIISDRSSWNDPFVSIIWGIEVLDAGYDYEEAYEDKEYENIF